jgi:valyl-tRNA synthetase
VSTAAQASIDAVKNSETVIHPERFNQSFEQWM